MLVRSQKYDEMQKQYQAMQIESEQKIRDLKVMFAVLQSIMPTSVALMTSLVCSHIPGVCTQQTLEKEKEISTIKVMYVFTAVLIDSFI